ncbi:Calpain catalytic domain-containing protein [Caenorhabditis elegans]|uniref:Calpain catalytic domain-containing protein n=1 Tax=Caenorhabditis elegans TaxID=6239 RepID=Q9N4B2_CAEEL|nr:Calpain catalytic domain-containing protein [Caenorhabditis elegans]CCD72595.2 Calpain catalytic domain-containing protein [Caenorhabditis elegans]|eukprot:NP_500081.2 CaLPain family [Caenorhabditis elegans]
MSDEEVLNNEDEQEENINNNNLPSIVKEFVSDYTGSIWDELLRQLTALIPRDSSGRGLTNIFSSGALESLVGNLISNASHEFFGVNSENGEIIGALAGNAMFNLGGENNSLSSIGKVVLDNIVSGKFKRECHSYVPLKCQPLYFYEERQKCLDENRLFEDPQFPANNSSIYYKKPPKSHIVWLRPAKIFANPRLIVNGKSRFDVRQGSLGNCWFLAAAATLAQRDELFYRVVPPDQSFTENYAGIFHFQFWRYGEWVDVVIDDRLPTVNGKLIYMSSQDGDECWGPLLEKAYAKLYGTYEHLDGGTTTEALEDFTGGLTEFYDLTSTDKTMILAMIMKGMQMGSLFACSIDPDPREKEAQLANGLVRGHAYSVTGVHTVETDKEKVALLRIRNPWGDTEWNGDWSDKSSLWEQVDQEQREKMEFRIKEDGEFWMCLDDFMAQFANLDCCNLSADVMHEITEMTEIEVMEKQSKQWIQKSADGEWCSRKGTAGGCSNNENTFCTNPQYETYFRATSPSSNDKCTVIAAVFQKYRRNQLHRGLDMLQIGLSVYKMSGPNEKVTAEMMKTHAPIASTKLFVDYREAVVRFTVPPGYYVIVPCTFEPNHDAEFLLRTFSNVEFDKTRLRRR